LSIPAVPLEEGQGCIAGPKATWVGIYWIAPTLLYTASFALALMRSLSSLNIKPMTSWKLMLRDGLNLYAAIFLVNLANMLFWFIMPATGPEDPVKTIITRYDLIHFLFISIVLLIQLFCLAWLRYSPPP
jgi:hypothetical protein